MRSYRLPSAGKPPSPAAAHLRAVANEAAARRQSSQRHRYGMGRELADGADGTAGQPLGHVIASTSITRAVWALFHAW